MVYGIGGRKKSTFQEWGNLFRRSNSSSQQKKREKRSGRKHFKEKESFFGKAISFTKSQGDQLCNIVILKQNDISCNLSNLSNQSRLENLPFENRGNLE